MGYASKLAEYFTLAALLGFGAYSHATTVQFQTVLGDFEVELYDEETPITTANFLEYVEASAYTDSIFHRLDNDFILQGGGYTFNIENSQIEKITQNDSIKNEPFFSNTRGTIAMAKLPGQPNSATSQWFINLEDSNDFLDSVDGGFTVFGKVTGEGMSIIDDIAALKIGDYRSTNSAFRELPLRNVTSSDLSNKTPLTEDNLMLIKNIMVLGATTTSSVSSISSSSSSSSDMNTSSSVNFNNSTSSSSIRSSETSVSSSSTVASVSSNSAVPATSNSGGGGGSASWLMLLALLSAGIAHRAGSNKPL